MTPLEALKAWSAGGFRVLGLPLIRTILEFSSRGDGFPLRDPAAGLFAGAWVSPRLLFNPWRVFGDCVKSIPGSALVSGTAGLLVGLVVASLISIPLYSLGGWKGWGVPILVSTVLGLGGLWVGAGRRTDVEAIFPALEDGGSPGNGSLRPARKGKILVDTSAIIDGRLADLSTTGFLEGALVVPRFVLDELRHIADSSDPLRRNRGRRGLEVLGRLRKDNSIPVEVMDVGVDRGGEVDSSLVQLARSMKSPILTTDFNLNRVAELQGVQVLNVNELSNALRSIVLSGEELRVHIVQEGKEAGQGVAYLDDGTMVVIEGGKRYVNAFHDVVVTRVLQTAAGRIIFAQPKGG